MKYVIFWFLIVLSVQCDAGINCTVDQSPAKISLPSLIEWQKEDHSNGEISNEWYAAQNRSMLFCGGTDTVYYYIDPAGVGVGDYTLGGDSYKLYSTGVEGVAYIMSVQNKFSQWVPVSGRVVHSDSRPNAIVVGPYVSIRLGIRFKLIATDGALKAQSYTVPGFDVATASYDTGAKNYPLGTTTSTGTVITAKAKSCTLDAPATVNLKKSSFSQFKSVGDTSGDASFNLSLNCSDSFAAYSVSYFMTDANESTNTRAALVSSPGKDNVKGIGVQIVDGLTPINFGPTVTKLNKLSIGSVVASGGNLSKQLTARFVRTGAEMTPGVLTAAATITLVYD